MKRYNVGPRYTYPNGDTGPMDTKEYKCLFLEAETPAKARAKYSEKTGFSGKVSAEFICMVRVW